MSKNLINPPVLLMKSHNRLLFDCDVSALNEFLKRFALQNQKKDSARTYVATRDQDIVGYYTLAYGSVLPDHVIPEVKKGLGNYPIPVIVLARLAVDKHGKGNGLGRALLKDAFKRTLNAASIAGLRAILVHAKDESAISFYEKYGFKIMVQDRFTLMMSIKDIRNTLGQGNIPKS